MDAPLTARKLALDKGNPKARADSGDRFERSALWTSENYCARWTSASLGGWKDTGRMLKKFRLLTHPTPPRQDASFRGQGRRR
jgi:hypothetical protein